MDRSGYSLRPATAKDLWPIRWLVLSACLDPTQLRWQQFWVAEAGGKIIACGQLRQFAKAQELGSLVVAPRWRAQGIGRHLAQRLIEVALTKLDQNKMPPLYLECLGPALKHFYETLGFVPVAFSDLPPAIQRKFKLSTRVAAVLRLPLHQMQYRG